MIRIANLWEFYRPNVFAVIAQLTTWLYMLNATAKYYYRLVYFRVMIVQWNGVVLRTLPR